MKKRYPKLPPEPKLGDGSPVGEVMAQINDIFATSGHLSKPLPDDATKEQQMELRRLQNECLRAAGFHTSGVMIHRNQGAVGFIGIDRATKKDRLVFRIPGKAGADFDRLPLSVEIIRAEQSYEIALNKVKRNGRVREAKIKAAEETKAEVLRLAAKHADKGCHLARDVGQEIGITSRRVRQILEDEKEKEEISKLRDSSA